MQLEVFNRSKYRDGSVPGDDVPLVVPGAVYGVFDGATDARGTVVNGVAAGRLAATIVASEMAKIALDPACDTLKGKDIIDRLSGVLKAETDPLGLEIPPSTTIAVAFDCGATWRFLLLGDSGIRINGVDVHHDEKVIDDVSAFARVALFNEISRWNADLDEVESLTRRGIFLGFDNAIKDGILSAARAQTIVDETIAATGLGNIGMIVADFLRGGIQTQHRFGNSVGNSLCYDTMNGTAQQLNSAQDFKRAKADVTSIEIFTDGYPSLPNCVSLVAWEAEFQVAEEHDFNKTNRFARVRGSTTAEFYDDRTVIILR